jgi:hypothetical protein
MTLFRNITLALLTFFMSINLANTANSYLAEQNIMNLSITSSIEDQAAEDLYRFTQSINKQVNAKISDFIKTPKVATTWQKRNQKYSNWFCKWEGSAGKKFAKCLSWIAPIPLIPGIIGVALAPSEIAQAEPTLIEQASYAGFSLAALAAQTYVMDRVGFKKAKTITIGSVIELVKTLARKNETSLTDSDAHLIAQAFINKLKEAKQLTSSKIKTKPSTSIEQLPDSAEIVAKKTDKGPTKLDKEFAKLDRLLQT